MKSLFLWFWKIIKIIYRWIRIPVFLGILGFALYGGYSMYTKKDINQLQSTSEYSISQEDIITNIQKDGKVELAHEQKLRFAEQGTVKNIYAKPGDIVKKGDILAVLDMKEFNLEQQQLQKKIEDAKKNIAKLQDEIKTVAIPKTEQEIRELEFRLKENTHDYALLVKKIPEKIQENQIEFDAKLRDLARKKEKYAFDKTTYESELAKRDKNIMSKQAESNKIVETIIVDATGEFLFLQQAHKDMNQAFGFDASLFESHDFTNLIETNSHNYAHRDKASDYYNELILLLRDFNDIVYRISPTSKNQQDAQEIINIKKKIYPKFLLFTDALRNTVENTGKPNNSDSPTYETRKTVAENIANIRSNIIEKMGSISTLQDGIYNIKSEEIIKNEIDQDLQEKYAALQESEEDIKKLQIEIHTLEASNTLKNTEFSLEKERLEKFSAIQEGKLSIIQKKRALTLLKSGKNDELESLNTVLSDRKNEYQKLLNQKEKYEIRATFHGKIESIKMAVGDQITNNTTGNANDTEGFILLQDNSHINIRISLDQIDIGKIKIGQEAIITIRNDTAITLTGSISEVSSTPLDTENARDGMSAYQVKITANRGENAIYSGMNANISIETSRKENALVVPITAISEDIETQTQYITIIGNDGATEKRTVEVGASGNGVIEILTGATLGEKVRVIDFNNNTYQSDEFSGMGDGMMY